MYVNDCTLEGIASYINGYLHGFSDTSDVITREAWLHWIGIKYHIWHSGWAWQRSILHSVGSEQKAIEILPDLAKEFVNDIIKYGISGIKKKHTENFKAEYDKFGYISVEPNETFTKNP